jgi:hypothetical protein
VLEIFYIYDPLKQFWHNSRIPEPFMNYITLLHTDLAMEHLDQVTTPTLYHNHNPKSIPARKTSQDMPGFKRSRDGSVKDLESSVSTSLPPFMPMFENFRDELDLHHDQRERIIKASRDITAASKKMYVVLAENFLSYSVLTRIYTAFSAFKGRTFISIIYSGIVLDHAIEFDH